MGVGHPTLAAKRIRLRPGSGPSRILALEAAKTRPAKGWVVRRRVESPVSIAVGDGPFACATRDRARDARRGVANVPRQPAQPRRVDHEAGRAGRVFMGFAGQRVGIKMLDFKLT
jgi:hypothetical protein